MLFQMTCPIFSSIDIEYSYQEKICLYPVPCSFGTWPIWSYSPLFENLRISLIPKKTPVLFRMIYHLSYPKVVSINNSIPPEFSTVKYAPVDDVISIIQRQGKGCAMAKTDERSAFRIVPVHPPDYPLLGFQWKEKWYYR